ncbi:MAG: sigma-70 family RNA polymerase sigma factor [Muribaculaceae bacterium]|nr:sigma-70 family RNA polymerase sigma factor [Muribaculaceae bacterium]
MENFIMQLAQAHFDSDRQAFINFIRRSFQLNGDEITDIYNEVWIDVIDNVRRGRTELVRNWKSYIFNLGWKRACKLVTRRAEMQVIDDEEVYDGEFNKVRLREMEEDIRNMEHLERIELMMTELEALPEKQRQILVLYYLKGKSAEEIAELMGYSGARSVITLKKRCLCIIHERMEAVA